MPEAKLKSLRGFRVGIIVCIASVLTLTGFCQAATYYISPNGNDIAGDGSIGNPWKRLSKAVPYLTGPGDTLYCRGGTYVSTSDSVSTSSSGSASQPITIRNYPSETPVFRSIGSPVIQLSGDYVVVDGLEFKPNSTAVSLLLAFIDSQGNYNIIRNCWFESVLAADGGYTYYRAIILDGQSNEIAGCTFKKFGYPDGDRGDDGFTLQVSGSYHYIHDNHFEEGVHENVGFFYSASHNVVRRNTFTNAGGYAIASRSGCHDNLIEFNSIQGCGYGLTTPDSVNKNAFNNASNGNIFRYNTSYDPVNYGVHAAQGTGQNCRIYNNAFWGGNVTGWKLSTNDPSKPQDNFWMNNIVAKCMQYGNWDYYYATVAEFTADGNESYYASGYNNQIFNNWIQAYVSGIWEDDWSKSVLEHHPAWTKRPVSQMELFFPATWYDNIYNYSDPHLADPDNGDFTITSSSSSLVDAGRSLTKTVGSGSGTSLTVTAGGEHFFWPGDSIAIGSAANVATISTSWVKGTNPLLLSTIATWADDEPIYLYSSAYEPGSVLLSGEAPDIGPYEFTHPDYLPGDLNKDGTTDIIDLNMVLIDWGKSVPNLSDPNSDADGSGTVDIVDLNTVLIDWGKTFHFLTVVSGTGTGVYNQSQVVPISADPAATGMQFSQWTGDITGIADINAADTTLTIPAGSVHVTATYADINYVLTVVSGAGGGSYTYSQAAAIIADAPLTSQQFDAWVGDVIHVADTASASTTITMFADSTVTATYQQAYNLTVVSGSGDGQYVAGQVIAIVASDPVAGQQFDAWVGDTANVANITLASTTITMPASDVAVTATYAPFEPIATRYTTKDAKVSWGWGADADKNYGVSSALEVRGGNYNVRPLFGFDVSGLGGTTVSATLNVYNRWSEGVDVSCTVYRLTQSWLEGTGNGSYTDDGATWNTYNGANTWSTPGGDYDTNSGLNFTVTTTRGQWFTLDVTPIVQYWRANPSENHGLIIISNETTDAGPPFYFDIRSREESNGAYKAYLVITNADPTTDYELTVVNGSGDGTYSAGSDAAISADAPPSGQLFDQWVGDVSNVTDTTAADTTISMVADATVTATYDTAFTLTVISGDGDGDYVSGTVVNIVADPDTTGWAFDVWTGDVSNVTDTATAGTTVTMVADATVSATYVAVDPIYSRIKYPYIPYDGSVVYNYSSEAVANTQRIQELDTLFARWGQKPYTDLWDGDSWQEERVIFTDVSTGATMYRLTDDYGADTIPYHKGAWSSNGANIVYKRGTPYYETQTSTHGMTVMNSDGTNIRPICRSSTVYSYQCSKQDPNVLYAMKGVSLTSYDISTGNDIAFLATWPSDSLKISMDGYYLLSRDYDANEIVIRSIDGAEYTLSTDGSIHDSYLIHPFLNYVMYWRKGYLDDPNEGFKIRAFDDSQTALSGFRFDWNHGIIGYPSLPGDANETPRVTGFHSGEGYFDGGTDGLTWSPGVNIWSPTKTGPIYDWFNPSGQSYATWMPPDEPWAFFSKLLGEPYVSQLTMNYVFPVANEGSNCFRICQMGNRTRWVLDGCDASPDGTKIIFKSDMLGATEVYMVVARLPEPPVNVSALESGGNVIVSWEKAKHSRETAGHHVYRSDSSGGNYTQINASLIDANSFIDMTANTGSTYYYVVTSVEHSNLEGTYSAEAAYGSGAATDERTVFIEAEATGDTGVGFWKGFYGTCSNLYYIWMRKAGANGIVTIPADLPRADDYYIWARIQSGGCDIEGQAINTTKARWTWVRSASTVSLSAGMNDLDVNSVDYGLGIDALYLTTDATFTPVGKNSMDAIAPSQITGVAASASGSFAANVSWDASGDADLHHYNLYIGATSNFKCDSETLIASPVSNSYLDWQLGVGTTYYYKVTAVDRQGNESIPSVDGSVTTGSLAIATVDQAVTPDPNDPNDLFTATVSIPSTGDYRLWIKLAQYNDRPQFRERVTVTIDGGASELWQWAPDEEFVQAGTTWLSYGTQSVYNLSAGSHTVTVYTHEEEPMTVDTMVTDIKLTTDMSWKPDTYFWGGFGWIGY